MRASHHSTSGIASCAGVEGAAAAPWSAPLRAPRGIRLASTVAWAAARFSSCCRARSCLTPSSPNSCCRQQAILRVCCLIVPPAAGASPGPQAQASRRWAHPDTSNLSFFLELPFPDKLKIGSSSAVQLAHTPESNTLIKEPTHNAAQLNAICPMTSSQDPAHTTAQIDIIWPKPPSLNLHTG